MDETYRRGREIPAAKMELSVKGGYVDYMQKEVSVAMFIRRRVQLKLYKLAIYTDGGHFDWHMDSTHGNNHHATVLLALNASWTGGDLVLRRNGVETRVDMHPKHEFEGYAPLLQMVAFYTDTEHKVEPVTEGVRIVLQFDVEVVGFKGNKREDDADKGGREETDANMEEGGGEEETYVDENNYVEGFELPIVKNVYSQRKSYKGDTGEDPEAVKEIVSLIDNLLSSKVREVGFAMQHIYRKSSILPEFLKGADALVYEALTKSFNVTLHPVVLRESTDYEGDPEGCEAYRFDQVEREENDSSEEEWNPREYVRSHQHKVDKSTIFHVPITSAIKQISEVDYVEHMGNEAQPGESRYFGGGMFVRRKEGA